LSTYSGVELPGCVTMLFSVFWGTATLFSTTARPFYIPINSAQGLQFLTFFFSFWWYWNMNSEPCAC
jgi:hypothetical protein